MRARASVVAVVGLGVVVAVSTALQAMQSIDARVEWRPFVLVSAALAGLVAVWQLVATAVVGRHFAGGQSAGLTDADPRRVGRYDIVARLGAGAMGRVYLAQGPDGEYVAVKVIRSDYADSTEFRRRFAREIQAVGQVRSPFTAPLLDADAAAAQPWLATSYVAGPSLQEAVETHGAWPTDSVWRLASTTAEALGAIHAAGVVHRDLKPSNILLERGGPQIIDFGIARARDASQLTGTANRPGTPAYMAPEQATGQPVGPQADVFALGVVLAFAATGRPPFGEGSSDVLLYRVVHQPPDLTGLDGPLRDLIEDCLAKDPSRRPTPSGVVERCRRHIASAGDRPWLPAPVATEVGQPPAPGAVRPPRRTRRWTAVTAGAALLIALASLTLQVIPGHADGRSERAGVGAAGEIPGGMNLAPGGTGSPPTSVPATTPTITATPVATSPGLVLPPTGGPPTGGPPPSRAITVEANLLALSPGYEGVCDPPSNATTYRLEISVSDGPVTVKYRIRNGDSGGSDPGVKSLRFAGTGPQTLTATHHETGYLSGYEIEGTLRAEVLSPVQLRSNTVPYRMHCTGPPLTIGNMTGSQQYVGACPHEVTYHVDVSVPDGSPPLTITYQWGRHQVEASDTSVKKVTINGSARISHTERYTASSPPDDGIKLIITGPTFGNSIGYRQDRITITCT